MEVRGEERREREREREKTGHKEKRDVERYIYIERDRCEPSIISLSCSSHTGNDDRRSETGRVPLARERRSRFKKINRFVKREREISFKDVPELRICLVNARLFIHYNPVTNRA